MSEVSIDRKDIVEDVPLPDGKDFHIFFSYRDVELDRKWVREILYVLESEFKLKCCDHLRDFRPGYKVVDNIKFFVPRSVKTVIVLSKEYENSYWCQFEMEYTLYMSNEMRQNLVIPVVIEDCEIPEHLKIFTYLDCRGDKSEWLPKFLSVIQENDNMNRNQPFTAPKLISNYKNLDIIHEECTGYTCCQYSAHFGEKYLPQALDIREISLDLSVYNDIRREIESICAAKYHGCRHKLMYCVIAFAVCFILNGLVFTIIGAIEPHTGALPFGFGNLMFSGIIIFICIVTGMKITQKGREQLIPIQIQANKTIVQYNLMMCAVVKRTHIYMAIVFYDWIPCLKYTSERLKTIFENLSGDEINFALQTDDIHIHTDQPIEIKKDFNEDALKILTSLTSKYLIDFLEKRLAIAVERRHCSRAICLCQYAEALTNMQMDRK